MRTLTGNLETNQSALGVDGRPQSPLWKIVLSRASQSTQTYTKTRVLAIQNHIEEEDNQIATVLLDNSDNALTSIDFEMYKGVISYGYNDPTNGDEYSDCAPLYVLGQRLFSAQGLLVCQLNLIGIPNLMAMDKAESELILTEDDARTVKDLLTAVANASLTPYSGYTNYTVTYDSEDVVINFLKPKDSFQVAENENRLDKIIQLMGWTGNKWRVEADGNIHTFNPVTSGSTYDYEYKLAVASFHTFLNKELRNRFVNPNKVIVKSHDAHEPQYTGSATSAASFALFPKTETIRLKLNSGSDATDIAAARIETHELDADTGAVSVPMNVGQEVWDFINMTDSRQGDSRKGNVRQIIRNVQVPQRGGRFVFDMSVRFGKTAGLIPILLGQAPGEDLSVSVQALIDAYRGLREDVNTLVEKLAEIIDHVNRHHEVFHSKAITAENTMRIPGE